MKVSSFLYFAKFGIKTVLFKQKKPILGTIILTDKCNLKSAFPYLIDNKFPTPCHQCVVMENGKLSTCGRCIDVDGLCEKCGYFFVAEYTLVFKGKIRVIADMLRTYLRYI